MLTHGRLPWRAGTLSCGVGSPCRTEPSNCFTIFCRPCAPRLTAPRPPNSALVHRPAYARAGFGYAPQRAGFAVQRHPRGCALAQAGAFSGCNKYTLHEERSVTQSPPTESQLLSSGSCSSAGAGAGAAGRGNRLVVKINFTTLDATGATGRPPGAGAGV